ncbi:MAG: glycosyltransferase, partial [Mangrovicoccus sp.]
RFDGPQPQVWSHLAMADLLIYPTFFDTFGLIIGEALAAGCPVITSRAAGITDLLPQTPALHLVDRAEDVDGLTQALRTLPSGPEISAAARQAVTDLSWNAHLDGVEEVYDKTVRSR